MTDSYSPEAQTILGSLASLPFEECYGLSREFRDVPTCPGLYAVRHQTEGILYIGQANNLRRRFRDGHKAFFWAFLKYCTPDQIRIATEQLGRQSFLRADQLEALMIRIAKPRYNTLMK